MLLKFLRCLLLWAFLCAATHGQICLHNGTKPHYLAEKFNSLQITIANTVLPKFQTLQERQDDLELSQIQTAAAVVASEHWKDVEEALEKTLLHSNVSTNATEVLWQALNATIAHKEQLRSIEDTVLKKRVYDLEKGAAQGAFVVMKCPANGKFDYFTQQCVCNDGYQGFLCQQPVCESCKHGECTAPNSCTCKGGYTGESCETPLCSFPCQHGGVCIAPNLCGHCDEGYSGADCSRNGTIADVRILSPLGSTCPSAGILQIWVETRWSSVCNDDFGMLEGRVACRMAGYDDIVVR